MFDIGWTELAVIACVAILVVGPKELPGMLRTIGKTVGQLRKMAGDFQKQFDDAIREAELDEVKKTMKAPFQPLEDARKAALDFQGSVNKSINEIGKDASAGMPSGSATGEVPPVPAAFTAPLPTPVMPQPAAPAAISEAKAEPKAKAAARPAGKSLTKSSAKSPARTAAKTQKPDTKSSPPPKAVTKSPAAKAAEPASKAAATKRAKPAPAAPVPAKTPAAAGKAKPGKKA